MIKPPPKSDLANRVASQSLQLLKAYTDLQFSRLSSGPPQSIGAIASVTNQSVSNLLAKILPDLMSSLNQAPIDAMSSAKINQVVLVYRLANIQHNNALKAIYMADKITNYMPLISKLRSLQLPLFQPADERLAQQPSVNIASFPFPNAPISSEYFKFFELFQKKNLPTSQNLNKKKYRNSKQKRKGNSLLK